MKVKIKIVEKRKTQNKIDTFFDRPIIKNFIIPFIVAIFSVLLAVEFAINPFTAELARQKAEIELNRLETAAIFSQNAEQILGLLESKGVENAEVEKYHREQKWIPIDTPLPIKYLSPLLDKESTIYNFTDEEIALCEEFKRALSNHIYNLSKRKQILEQYEDATEKEKMHAEKIYNLASFMWQELFVVDSEPEKNVADYMLNDFKHEVMLIGKDLTREEG